MALWRWHFTRYWTWVAYKPSFSSVAFIYLLICHMSNSVQCSMVLVFWTQLAYPNQGYERFCGMQHGIKPFNSLSSVIIHFWSGSRGEFYQEPLDKLHSTIARFPPRCSLKRSKSHPWPLGIKISELLQETWWIYWAGHVTPCQMSLWGSHKERDLCEIWSGWNRAQAKGGAVFKHT